MSDRADAVDAIRRDMNAQGIDLLLVSHDGAHFIEKPNALFESALSYYRG